MLECIISMVNFPHFLAHLLFFYVLLGEPYAAYLLYRSLIINSYFQPRARIDFYYRKLSVYWILIGLVAVVGLTYNPASINLWIGQLNDGGLGLLMVVLLTALIAFILLVFWEKLRKPFLSVTSLTPSILPETLIERFLYAAMAISGGLSEELVYRGFLWFYFRMVFPALPVWCLVIFWTFLFTAGHYYQYQLNAQKGEFLWSGISTLGLFGNMVMGLVYGTMVAFSGSLIPSIVLHALYDLNAILARPSWGLASYRRRQESTRISR